MHTPTLLAKVGNTTPDTSKQINKNKKQKEHNKEREVERVRMRVRGSEREYKNTFNFMILNIC